MGSLHGLQRYWRFLARYLRTQSSGMLLLGMTLGISLAIQVGAPLIAGRFIDRALASAALPELIGLALFTMLLALAGQVATILETYLAERVSWTATNSLRTDLLSHLLRLDASFHNSHTPGELIERSDGDVGMLARFFSRFVVAILGNLALILAVLGLMLVMDWRVGLALSAFVVLAFLVMLRIRASATPLWAAERQTSAEFYGFLGEYLAGREDLRANGAVTFVMRRCAETMRTWLARTRMAQLRGYALVASSQGLFALGTITALGLSAMLFREGSLTIGMVYLLFRYTDMLRQPAEQLRNEIQDLQQADASLGRVEALLQLQPGLEDAGSTGLPAGPLSVTFERVSFGYHPHSPILHDVNIALPAGRVLGVIGRTGSGKTTLTRLLLRFYDPQGGSLRLGGVDLRAVPLATLRARIGLVTQDVQVFNASVRDNLTLFHVGVAPEHLHRVLAQLGLAPWLEQLPNGLDTLLGAGGIGLSAGQAQALACARIFLRNPDLVVLDEASARLDLATERLLHTAIGRMLTGRTGIIIAHRLDTIAYADDILVLEQGRVLEYGPRAVLAANPDSHYASLLRLATEELV